MQTPIPKFRESSLNSKKPGYFFSKIEIFDKLPLPSSLIFFTEVLHTVPT